MPCSETEQPLDVARIEKEVADGLLDPGEADELLVDRFLPPFSRNPRSPDIWSSNAPLWSLEMVAAWIIWGDRALTLRHFHGSFEGAKMWVSNAELLPFLRPRPPGHKLYEFQRTTVMRSFIGYDGKHHSFTPFASWMPGLIAHLVTSRIKAVACETEPDRERVDVPRKDWETAEFDVDETGSTVLRVAGRVKFTHLLFLASEVLQIYPAQRKPDGLRKWKLKPPLEELSEKELRMYEIIRRMFKDGVPIGEASTRNKKLEARADALGIGKWERHTSFARFIDRVLEKVCEEPSGGPGRPRKNG
ncbi:hypothetical protein CO676_20025 [Sinorhizobium sp. BJ1]|nr:hypothetical protein CO676_20025 [Sinorhizobium sp. BJ1]